MISNTYQAAFSEETLRGYIDKIRGADRTAAEEAERYVQTLAAPPGSLGKLEEAAVQLAGITGLVKNRVDRRRIIVLCADNGVVAEGVSVTPPSVTLAQAVNMTKSQTGMSTLAKRFGSEVEVVDVGIDADLLAETGRSAADADLLMETGRNAADANLQAETWRSAADADLRAETGRNAADVNLRAEAGRSAADADLLMETGRSAADTDLRAEAGRSAADADLRAEAGASDPQCSARQKPALRYTGPSRDILPRKIRRCTGNIVREPAMTREEAVAAIGVGIERAVAAADDGIRVIGVGEMGIGNTTTSSAVFSVLTGLDVEMVTGRGGGLTDDAFLRKKKVIGQAIALHQPDPADPVDVLSKVGGLDIAAMCGVYLGAAMRRIPVVIDGFISIVAALCAVRLCPDAKDFMFPSHASMEPGYLLAARELGLRPWLFLDMCLGEGSGCPLAFLILDAACTLMNDMETFEEAQIDDGYLEEIREIKEWQKRS